MRKPYLCNSVRPDFCGCQEGKCNSFGILCKHLHSMAIFNSPLPQVSTQAAQRDEARRLRAALSLFLTLEAGPGEKSERLSRVTNEFANERNSQSTISTPA